MIFGGMTIGDQPARPMRFGILIVNEFEEFISDNLQALTENLTELGCLPSNIVLKCVPTLQDAVLGTSFYAQYTDVDGVIILAPLNRAMGTLSLMNGISSIQLQWNMVVEIGGAECAKNAVDMVSLQNEMEEEAPDVLPRVRFS